MKIGRAMWWSVCLLALAAGTEATAQWQGKTGAEAIQELLDGFAPPPDWREHLRKTQKPRVVPPASASDDDLIEYWEWAPADAVPDAPTQRRVVEICESQPTEFPALARFLPKQDEEAAKRLNNLHDRLAAKHNEEGEALAGELHKWLMFNSAFFRDDLVQSAASGSNEAVARLIEVDATLAESCLRDKATDADRTVRACALSALVRHPFAGVDEKMRAAYLEELKRIAMEKGTARPARRQAIAAVMASDWPGKEKWFLGLLADPSLASREKYSAQPAPLTKVVAGDPEKWIPRLIPLLANPNEAIRAGAARCLVYFHGENARRDALKPLLPWIANPRWVKVSEDEADRFLLLQSLTNVDLPESIPYLRKSVRTDKEYDLEATAQALAHYKVRDSVPLLRQAAEREKDPNHRCRVVGALLELEAFTPDEIAPGMRDYAIKVAALPDEEWSNQAWDEISKSPHSILLDLGHEVCGWTEIKSEDGTKAVLEQIAQLSPRNPRAAEILWNAIANWPTETAYAAIIERLKSGRFTTGWLVTLIEAKTALPDRLKALRDLAGMSAGIQAALSRERSLIEKVLRGNDAEAKRAMLACARAGRIELPFEQTVPLLDSQDERVKFAAECYLESTGTPEARAELRKRRQGERRVSGEQLNFSAFPMDRGDISRTEKELNEFFKQLPPPREIYALLSEGNFGGDGQRALFAYDDRTVLRCGDGNGRTREREVSPAEFAALRQWIDKNKVADLPPYDEGTLDGIQLQYVHMRPDGGERVFMNNPPGGPTGAASVTLGHTEPRPDPIVYAELTRRMMKLNRVPMTVIYPTLKTLEGYRVLHAKEDGEVVALSRRQGALCAGVLVDRDKGLQWHAIKDTGLVSEFQVDAPDRAKADAIREMVTLQESVDVRAGRYAGKYLWSGSPENKKIEGLWASAVNGEPELIVRGAFSGLVICPGGDWVVAAKAGGRSWAGPNGVVRIHLPDKRMFAVDLPPADNFDPVAWVDAHQRVFLYQQRDRVKGSVGPDKPEFYLLDPVTGAHEKIEGEFRPFFDAGRRALQPTGHQDEFWAALHASVVDPKLHTTTIGRFDSRGFRFTPLLTFPEIQFDSSNFFVDQSAHLIWIALNGDLLRLALP